MQIFLSESKNLLLNANDLSTIRGTSLEIERMRSFILIQFVLDILLFFAESGNFFRIERK